METAQGALAHGERDDFAAWLETPFVRVLITRQHGQFYAYAPDFGIAGLGATEAEACSDMARLLAAYLRSYFAEGRPYQDALRRERRSFPWGTVRSIGQALGSIPPLRLTGRKRDLVLTFTRTAL